MMKMQRIIYHGPCNDDRFYERRPEPKGTYEEATAKVDEFVAELKALVEKYKCLERDETHDSYDGGENYLGANIYLKHKGVSDVRYSLFEILTEVFGDLGV